MALLLGLAYTAVDDEEDGEDERAAADDGCGERGRSGEERR